MSKQIIPHGGDTKSGKQGRFKKRKKQIHPFKNKEKQWKQESREIDDLKARYDEINSSSIQKFTDFPLSKKTLEGLELHKYSEPTEIQQETIGLILQGHDVLGAAKTGSGKTLAFLVPILECLHQKKWSSHDGLGALIISPTRELAYQTFEVLRKVGKKHDFSAGLVIGGKLVKEEAERINRTNIVICTPGRLLQHMDETINFSADSLQMLVLDEADRILDLGFQQTVNAIIENLPEKRQTVLFSATQTKSVKDLARLSLKNPMYVSVHEHSKHSTPAKLQQSYIVCELHEKIDILWSFIKHHPKSKILVFVMSCKQVKFLHDMMCRLRPGISVLALHGAMKQMKRMSVYEQFCRKQHAVLLATDIAARGLDFPSVNWVLQLDCPEDANTYIHRAGRTARYEKDGEALLVLLPSEEEAMAEQLTAKKIPISKIKVNPTKQSSIQGKMEANLAADVALKESAQRAFVSYLRSVFLMKDKKVFNVHALDGDVFARSLGLAIPPRVRFLEKQQKIIKQRKQVLDDRTEIAKSKFKMMKNLETVSKGNEMENEASDSDGSSAEKSENEASYSSDEAADTCENISTKMERTSDHSGISGDISSDQSSDSEKEAAKCLDSGFNFTLDNDLDDIFRVKKKAQVDSELESEDEEVPLPEVKSKKSSQSKPLTKFAVAKKLQKKNLKVNTKVTFDEEGEVVEAVRRKQKVTVTTDDDDDGGINIDLVKERMREEDKYDKQLYRERIKKKHREERIKLKEQKRAKKENTMQQEDNVEEEPVAYLDQSETTGDYELPDPDKYYGKQSDDDSEESDSVDSGSESDDESKPISKKRKLAIDEVPFDTGMSLEDDEAIALQLLRS